MCLNLKKKVALVIFFPSLLFCKQVNLNVNKTQNSKENCTCAEQNE